MVTMAPDWDDRLARYRQPTFKAVESTGLFLYNPLTDQCMALSMHLYYIATQASNAARPRSSGSGRRAGWRSRSVWRLLGP